MTDDDDISAQDVRAAFAEILPHGADRKIVCGQLLKSIGFCEDIGSRGWSVSLLDRGFRLNVGQVEAMTCTYTLMDRKTYAITEDYGFLDFRFLVSGPEAQALLRQYDPELMVPMEYRSVKAPHWAVTITLNVEGPEVEDARPSAVEAIEAVQAAHRHFVQAAALSPNGRPRSRSHFARFHCEPLVAYAREEHARAPDPPAAVIFAAPFGQVLGTTAAASAPQPR